MGMGGGKHWRRAQPRRAAGSPSENGSAERNRVNVRCFRAAALAVLLAGASLGPACAAGPVARDGGFSHAKRGWWIGAPDGAWTRASVEGADLVFREPAGAWMSLASRCQIALADPRVLVRHLVIGLPERTLLREGEVRVDGRAGWSQTWRTRRAERELKAVSVVAGGCVYDWVLVAPPGSSSVEASFDRWWGSFRLPEPAPSALGAAP